MADEKNWNSAAETAFERELERAERRADQRRERHEVRSEARMEALARAFEKGIRTDATETTLSPEAERKNYVSACREELRRMVAGLPPSPKAE